jgi:phosphoadenosine phosphosulfate reductase
MNEGQMMLIEFGLFGVIDKVAEAIKFLREMEPSEGYWLAFSGGKDSQVIYELAKLAGVRFEAHYNFTTIDPPELVKFIRAYYPDVTIDKPNESFFKLVERKGYPTRQCRWCCDVLKERGGIGRKVITGVRKAESAKRAKRKMIEICWKGNGKIYINPIIDWLESDVWDFIKGRGLPYCELYDQGWTRIGCLFCPMAQKRIRLEEVKRYPKFVNAFIHAFDKRLEIARERDCKVADRFKTGEELFWWWLRETHNTEPDQTVMFE